MVKLKSTLLPLAVALALPLGTGCKKRSTTASSPPVVSPVGNAAASSTPLSEGVGEAAGSKAGAEEKDWRKEDESEAKKGKKKTPLVADKAGSSAKKEAVPDEAEKRRTAFERKVDGVLNSGMGALKRCFEQGGEAGGRIVLRFRVHRSGYVLSPGVSGVGAGAEACAKGVLGKMKVTGNDVGTIDIVRTLKFERRTAPR